MTKEVLTINASIFTQHERLAKLLNEKLVGKNIRGVFFNSTSLTKGTYEILVEDPKLVEIDKIVEKLIEVPELSPGKGNGTSRYRGVYWDKECKRWRAQLSNKLLGKRKMKRFDSEIEAAKQYDEWAMEVRKLGGKAYLNFEKVAK